MNIRHTLPAAIAGPRAAQLLAGLVALWARACWRIAARNPLERWFWAYAGEVMNCLAALLDGAAAGQADLSGTMRVVRRPADRARPPATAGEVRDVRPARPRCRAPHAGSPAPTAARVRMAGDRPSCGRGVRGTGATISRALARPRIGLRERRRCFEVWSAAPHDAFIVAIR